MMSSGCLFCLSPVQSKPKIPHLLSMHLKENQQILTSKKLEPASIWHCCLKNDFNYKWIVKIVGNRCSCCSSFGNTRMVSWSQVHFQVQDFFFGGLQLEKVYSLFPPLFETLSRQLSVFWLVSSHMPDSATLTTTTHKINYFVHN